MMRNVIITYIRLSLLLFALPSCFAFTLTRCGRRVSIPRVGLLYPTSQLNDSSPWRRPPLRPSLLASSDEDNEQESEEKSSSPSSVVHEDNDTRKSGGLLDRLKALLPTEKERKKMVPLGIMFFCILFNYTILRSTKDVLMVTAPGSGAEVIPFLKTYVNLPAAIGFTALYVELTEALDLKNVFYAFVIPFLLFFASFPILIYPNHPFLHPHEFIDILAGRLHHGFAAPLAIARNWSFSVFYVLAEMWGSVVSSLLFWGFANEVTTVPEAKKYYPLFGLGANFALIASGQYIKWVGRREVMFGPDVDSWAVSLKYLMGAVVASGGVMLGTYKYMQDKVIGKSIKLNAGGAKKKKPKLSMRESIKFLVNSKYLRDLAILVVSGAMCINIVEVSWKAKLKQQFPDPSSYSAFMGNFASCTGVATLTMMLLARFIFEKFSWGTAALVTPVMMGVTGLGFFALNIFPEGISPAAALIGTTPLMLAVLIGALQNILSKSSKYSLFDPAKEMAFIPLDQESKTKGKAAIDVVGVLLGKSGGSLLQQILIFATGSLVSATPYLAAFLTAVIFFWFRATNSLAKQFDEAMANVEE